MSNRSTEGENEAGGRDAGPALAPRSERDHATRAVAHHLDRAGPVELPARPSWRRRLLRALLAVVGAVVVGTVVVQAALNRTQGNTTEAPADDGDSPLSAAETWGPAPTEGAGAPATPVTTATGAGSSPLQAAPSTISPVRGTLAEGRLVLEGTLPSAAEAESLVALMESVVGAGNVDSAVAVDSQAPEASEISLVVADEISFGLGSIRVANEFLPILDQIVVLMNLDPNVSIVVKGHTDGSGDPVNNLALSQQRAEAVVDYFAEQGINRFRLEARGRGSAEPVADDSTAEGQSRNRRIEFEIIGLRLDQPR